MKKILIVVVLLVGGLAGLLYLANRYVNDSTIPIGDIAAPGDRVLAVFAHPDDEITVSGTLASLDANDIATGVVYLTRGEAGPTGGLVPRDELGDARTQEVYAVQRILGLDYVKLFDFPDSGVPGSSADDIKQAVLNSIEEFRPSVVIGFDETIGFYGHEDHRLAGLYLHALLDERRLPYVKSYYMVTLPQPMIDMALKVSDMFRERYARDPTQGLPPADLAVRMWRFGDVKKAVLNAHKTQWEIIDDVQPYATVTPSWLYYRVLDREYFHRVEIGENSDAYAD